MVRVYYYGKRKGHLLVNLTIAVQIFY